VEGNQMSRLNRSLQGIQDRDEGAKLDGDEFYTPSALAGRLVGLLDLLPATTALDPFAGAGAFQNHLEKIEGLEVDWCEIHRGRDFFKEKREFDWLISNPPFSKLTKVLEHSCRLAKKGFAYILPSYALNMRRLKICESWGFVVTGLWYFDNPKEWQLGFPMVWVVFERTSGDIEVFRRVVRILDEPIKLQTRLEEFNE
jgi:hypothetical protein